jgi:hypothetical protein
MQGGRQRPPFSFYKTGTIPGLTGKFNAPARVKVFRNAPEPKTGANFPPVQKQLSIVTECGITAS